MSFHSRWLGFVWARKDLLSESGTHFALSEFYLSLVVRARTSLFISNPWSDAKNLNDCEFLKFFGWLWGKIIVTLFYKPSKYYNTFDLILSTYQTNQLESKLFISSDLWCSQGSLSWHKSLYYPLTVLGLQRTYLQMSISDPLMVFILKMFFLTFQWPRLKNLRLFIVRLSRGKKFLQGPLMN